jgi:hypothetical protein
MEKKGTLLLTDSSAVEFSLESKLEKNGFKNNRHK